MVRVITLFIVLLCLFLIIQATTGCSGGLAGLNPPANETGDTSLYGNDETPDDATATDNSDDSDETAYVFDPFIADAENMICIVDRADIVVQDKPDESEHTIPPTQVTADQRFPSKDPSEIEKGLCGTKADITNSSDIQISEIQIQPCGITVPVEYPQHEICNAVSDVESSFDPGLIGSMYGMCELQYEYRRLSVPQYIFRTDGSHLTRHEALHECMRLMSCDNGILKNIQYSVAHLMENASSPLVPADVIIKVKLIEENYYTQISDMGNMANAALVLNQAGLELDEDIPAYNQEVVDLIFATIEEECSEE